MTAMAQIEQHAKDIREGRAKIGPGNPIRISEAADVGEGVWQGDLGIEIVDTTPPLAKAIWIKGDLQLVPGNTQGSKHVLQSAENCLLWMPDGWGHYYEGLIGPTIKCLAESTIVHPTHGAVTIPADRIVRIRYQRERDAELKRDRRNAD